MLENEWPELSERMTVLVGGEQHAVVERDAKYDGYDVTIRCALCRKESRQYVCIGTDDKERRRESLIGASVDFAKNQIDLGSWEGCNCRPEARP